MKSDYLKKVNYINGILILILNIISQIFCNAITIKMLLFSFAPINLSNICSYFWYRITLFFACKCERKSLEVEYAAIELQS